MLMIQFAKVLFPMHAMTAGTSHYLGTLAARLALQS